MIEKVVDGIEEEALIHETISKGVGSVRQFSANFRHR
jgi:hypothetical protein